MKIYLGLVDDLYRDSEVVVKVFKSKETAKAWEAEAPLNRKIEEMEIEE